MTPQYRVVSTAKKATVLLVDDHPIVRQGLTQLINQEPDLAVCGQAEDANGAFHAIATHRPDVVVLDISLNGPDGLTVQGHSLELRNAARTGAFHARRVFSTPNACFAPAPMATS
jgi:DNA-binding NarL/FixJ family response regulator